ACLGLRRRGPGRSAGLPPICGGPRRQGGQGARLPAQWLSVCPCSFLGLREKRIEPLPVEVEQRRIREHTEVLNRGARPEIRAALDREFPPVRQFQEQDFRVNQAAENSAPAGRQFMGKALAVLFFV